MPRRIWVKNIPLINNIHYIILLQKGLMASGMDPFTPLDLYEFKNIPKGIRFFQTTHVETMIYDIFLLI
jgi:hypothetical protein